MIGKSFRHGPTSNQVANNDIPSSTQPEQPFSPPEHFALLTLPTNPRPLRRKEDLLADGVAAIFELAGDEAILLGLRFQAKHYSPAQATRWLAERGFAPLLFVPNADFKHL